MPQIKQPVKITISVVDGDGITKDHEYEPINLDDNGVTISVDSGQHDYDEGTVRIDTTYIIKWTEVEYRDFNNIGKTSRPAR